MSELTERAAQHELRLTLLAGRLAHLLEAEVDEVQFERLGVEPEAIRLVKVDTEGHEAHVLAGSPRLLQVDGVVWQIEFSPSRLRRSGSDPQAFLVQLQQTFSHFLDVDQSEPVVEAEPGFEGEVAAFNLFAYLSRSDVTWNPSVVSACKDSLFCPTTEEYILPIIHGNDRVEWFVQLSDEIVWDVQHRDTGAARTDILPIGADEVVGLLRAHIDAGITKFVLRPMTLSSMYANPLEFDGSILLWEDRDGAVHSLVLNDAMPRGQHLFSAPLKLEIR